YDGDLPGLVQRFSPYKTIIIEFEEGAGPEEGSATIREAIGEAGEIVESSPVGLTLRVPKADTSRVTGHLLATIPIADLTVEDPPIEEVIERVFASKDGTPDPEAETGVTEQAREEVAVS
ncbi:MAG: hypothetical protein H0W23_05335, partial [Chloroflexia bacterium]|nr:hypothetical protein [Chloroflexia bacterium]